MTKVPVSQYQNKDDAVHPYPGDRYYEWWYLDAQFDNGYSCVITFHNRLVFMEPHFPAIQMHIYSPDGKSVVGFKPIDAKDVSVSEDYCEVKMGNNFVRQENGTYKVSVHTRHAGAELTFKTSFRVGSLRVPACSTIREMQYTDGSCPFREERSKGRSSSEKPR